MCGGRDGRVAASWCSGTPLSTTGLEGRGERLYLIAMLDDATSRALARFVLHDSTAENMRLLWTYLERWGRPLEFYTDQASLFHVNPRLHYNKQVAREPHTAEKPAPKFRAAELRLEAGGGQLAPPRRRR